MKFGPIEIKFFFKKSLYYQWKKLVLYKGCLYIIFFKKIRDNYSFNLFFVIWDIVTIQSPFIKTWPKFVTWQNRSYESPFSITIFMNSSKPIIIPSILWEKSPWSLIDTSDLFCRKRNKRFFKKENQRIFFEVGAFFKKINKTYDRLRYHWQRNSQQFYKKLVHSLN